MNNYKFRGKRLDNGEWVYGNLVQTEVETFIIPFDQLVTNRTPQFDESFVVDPLTVGQFTGLKDSKGKEIFEGDTVSGFNFGGMKKFDSTIEFIRGEFKTVVKDWDVNSSICSWSIPIEVTGTIHDTPTK